MSEIHKDETNHQLACMSKLAQEYTVRMELVTSRLAATENPRPPLVVTGPAGCGKTTYLARLGESARTQGWKVIPLFASFFGPEPGAAQVRSCLARQLDTLTGDRASMGQLRWQTPPGWLPGQPEVLVLLDGLEPDVLEELLPGAPVPGIFFALSLGERQTLRRKCETLTLPEFTGNQRIGLLQSFYETAGFRASPLAVSAMSKKSAAGNPLYLTLLAQRLLVAEEGKNQTDAGARQSRVVEAAPDGLEAMAVELLGVAAQKAGGNMAVQAAAFLAVSHRGLRQQDLEGIFDEAVLTWKPEVFTGLLRYLGRFLCTRSDGRQDFRNETFRKGILGCFKNRSVMHRTLLQYLSTLPPEDAVGLEERLYHLLLLREPQDVLALINQIPEKLTDTVDPRLVPCLMEKDWALLRELLTPNPRFRWTAGGFRYLMHLLDDKQAPATVLEDAAVLLERQGDKAPAAAIAAIYPGAAAALLEQEGEKNRERACSRLEKALHLLLEASRPVLKGTTPRLVAGMEVRCPLTALPELDPQGAVGRRVMELLVPLYEARGDCTHDKRALDLRRSLLTYGPEPLSPEEQAALCLDMGKRMLDSSASSLWEEGARWMQRAIALEKEPDEAKETGQPSAEPARWELLEGELLDRMLELAVSEASGQADLWRNKAETLAKERQRRAQEADQAEPANRVALAKAWETLGDIAALEKDSQKLLQSLELYQKSFAIFKALAKELDTPANRANLATAFEKIARVYGRMEGEANLLRAADLYRRSVNARQRVYAALETAESCYDMVRAHLYMGQVLAELDGEQNLAAAAAQYEQAITFGVSLCKVWKSHRPRYLLAQVFLAQSQLLHRTDNKDGARGAMAQNLALLPELAALELSQKSRQARAAYLAGTQAVVNLCSTHHDPVWETQMVDCRKQAVRLINYGFA